MWAGAPNASQSIAMGQVIEGVTTSNCHAVLSHDDMGRERMRLIPTGPDNNSYAEVTLPTEVRERGTVLANLQLERVLQGTLHENALNVILEVTPSEPNEAADNQVGFKSFRYHYEDTYTPFKVRLYHGGAKDSGDVYWSQLGFFQGEFMGNWADGSLGTYTNNDGMLGTPDWTGVPDESTTIINFSFPNFIADEWELIGQFSTNTEVVDYKGVTNGKTMYMIEAQSAIPSIARTLVPVYAYSPSVWINHGDTFEETLNLFYNLTVAETLDHPDANRQFFDGRPLPVLFNGVSVERGVTVTGSVYPREGRGATYDEMFELLNRPGPHLYRDMDGRRFYGNIDEFSSTRVSKHMYNLSFKIVEVEYEEF